MEITQEMFRQAQIEEEAARLIVDPISRRIAKVTLQYQTGLLTAEEYIEEIREAMPRED